MEKQHTEVRGDRVEARVVHDAGAAAACGFVVSVDRVAHEQRLAGEVGVVRARLGAGGNEGLAVLGVGADRRRDRRRGTSEVVERAAVAGVGDDERPVEGRPAEAVTHLLEPFA